MNIISNIDSKIVSFLRFPLIVGVIIIHNYCPIVEFPGETFGTLDHYFYNFFSVMFSQVLARVAVPLFFFFSGYLFFISVDNFNKEIYLSKIKRRFKTLLIPYLFWNILVLFFFYAISAIPSIGSLLNHKFDFSLSFFLRAMWATGEYNFPINYPFWFVRDLIVIVVLSPLIFFGIKHLKGIMIILLLIFWCFNSWIQVPGFEIEALCFFSLGAWYSINKKSFSLHIDKVKFLIFLYPIFVIADFLTQNLEYNFIIHKLGILIGIYFWLLISKYIVSNYKNRYIYILSTYSFFVFAFHEPLLTIVRKSIYIFLKPDTDILMTSLYFIVVLIVIGIALSVGYILKRILPKFFNVITGERSVNKIV